MTTLETAVQQTACTRPSVCFLKYGGGIYHGCTIVDSGLLHMSSVDRAGPDAGTDFALYSYQKFQPGFRDEKGQKSWRLFLARNWRNEANMMNNKTIIALPTFKAVSLQLNGMLMKWKILQAMRDDAIQLARIHQAFIPVTGLKCSYAKISSPPSHMNTSNLLQRI